MPYRILCFTPLLLALILFPGCQSERQEPSATGTPPSQAKANLLVCSFNIQFLGNPRARLDTALAHVVRECDIVVVQELIAPPKPGVFPNGKPFKPDKEAAQFFTAMEGLGYGYVLSEEDTGTNERIHLNSSGTEWWVTFYRPGAVQPAADLPAGFLAADRSNHPEYERVPYAFPFRTPDGRIDFVLISVHLMPGDGKKAQKRRQQELDAIARWIDANDAVEKDFIILGDMNIKDASELASATPGGFVSLNDQCLATNTNTNSPKPYDHIMYRPQHTWEIDTQYDIKVMDLIVPMKEHWKGPKPYPGDPYNHNEFRKHFSDHHPVAFQLNVPATDDDGQRLVAER